MIRERNPNIGAIPKDTIISTVDKFCMIDGTGKQSVLVKGYVYGDMTFYIQYCDDEEIHAWTCRKNETFRVLRDDTTVYRVDNVSVLFDLEYDKLV